MIILGQPSSFILNGSFSTATIYTLATRPDPDSVPEGTVINVSDLDIGSQQRQIGGYWITIGKPVIIDTDWWTDVDDAVAMRHAVYMENQGLINILGFCINTNLLKGPGSLDAMLIADGRAVNDISVPLTSHVPDGTPNYQNGLFELPHNAGEPSEQEDAVSMYRRLLAGSTGKVDIISIGYLNNLSELLDSEADVHSPLSGADLVTAKVDTLWVMGGSWPTGTENNFDRTAQAIAGANNVCANWPTRIVFSGFEIGVDIITGGNLAAALPDDHLTQALADHGSSAGRMSWDPMKLYFAALGIDDFTVQPRHAGYKLVQGTGSVDGGTGANSWVNSPSGPHYYTTRTINIRQYQADLNDCLVLGSQPATVPVFSYTPVVDDEHLVDNWVAADLSVNGNLANGAAVPYFAGRKQNYTPVQSNGLLKATFQNDIGGRAAMLFADDRYETEVYTPTVSMTVYALVRVTAVSGSARTFVSQDEGDPNRSWHAKLNSSGIPEAASFSGSTGVGDNSGAAVTANTWHVHTLRRNATQLEAYKDNVGNGSTAIGTANTPTNNPITFGARGVGSEPYAGYLAAVRIYNVEHDETTRAAVIAQMTE